MVPGILGKKIGMTQVFRPDGQVVPVTALQAGPCVVVSRKTAAKDGYEAIQLGLVEFIKESRVNRPMKGHLKKADAPPCRCPSGVGRRCGRRRRAEAGRSRFGW